MQLEKITQEQFEIDWDEAIGENQRRDWNKTEKAIMKEIAVRLILPFTGKWAGLTIAGGIIGGWKGAVAGAIAYPVYKYACIKFDNHMFHKYIEEEYGRHIG